MANKCLSFFVMVLLAMVIQNLRVAGDDLPMLNCMEVRSMPLVSFPADVTCDKFNFDFVIHFHCIKFHRSQKGITWKINMKFSQLILENGKRGLKEGNCGSILHMTVSAPDIGGRYSMTFDGNLAVGLSSGVCRENLTDCRYSMKMRADLSALPIFTFTPDEPGFWNFSSPVFRPDLGWLLTLDAEGAFDEHYPSALPGLAGSSLENITLKGSFGSDVMGQLPHLNNLTRLQLLIITNNPMTDLTPDDLTQTTDIRILHLLQNKFHKIPASVAQLKNLSELIFESITQNFAFHPETLDGLNELKTLTLSGTSIDRWTGKFKTLPSLEELNLSRCKIQSFSAAFSNFPKLRRLDVSKNLLTSLSSNEFKGLGKLTKLDLSHNFILELPQKIFIRDNPEPWIKFVNLSYNRIAQFSEVACASLSALEEVDIGSNIIDCDGCKASNLQHWLDVTETTVKNLGQNAPILCSHPPGFEGHLVQLMDFETCYDPGRFLWLGIGLPVAGVVVLFVIIGLLFYYRTEVLYFAHLAKVRATSKNKEKDTERKTCYDAFVCYSGKNRKWVMRRLMPLMERRPEYYSLCLFDRDFRLGTHIVTNIVDAIDQSRKVIVVLTQHFIDSKWCQWELEMAQHKLFSEDREFLVLLELEPLERRRLPRLLRFLLDTRPVVRWPRPETAPAVMAAAAELRAVLGPSLRQTLLADPPPMDELRPSRSAEEDKFILVANESVIAMEEND